MLPAFFPEAEQPSFDAKLVTNRARALVHAIRMRRANAYVPPSFFREFLSVATRPLFTQGERPVGQTEAIRGQWEDLLSLPLIVVPLHNIVRDAGRLTFDERCPPPDAWYVAAAMHAQATFWMSHAHRDDLVSVASEHVTVRLLSTTPPNY